jgi:hypothetical protein
MPPHSVFRRGRGVLLAVVTAASGELPFPCFVLMPHSFNVYWTQDWVSILLSLFKFDSLLLLDLLFFSHLFSRSPLFSLFRYPPPQCAYTVPLWCLEKCARTRSDRWPSRPSRPAHLERHHQSKTCRCSLIISVCSCYLTLLVMAPFLHFLLFHVVLPLLFLSLSIRVVPLLTSLCTGSTNNANETFVTTPCRLRSENQRIMDRSLRGVSRFLG